MSMSTREFLKGMLDPAPPKAAARSRSLFRSAEVFFYPIVVVGVTTGAAYLIHREANVTALPLVVVSVMLCAWKWGLKGGIWGALLAWFGYLFFFIPPTLTFYIRDEQSAVHMAELVFTSIITLWLTVGLDRSRQRFRAEHEHLLGILRQLPSGVLLANARSGEIVLANDQVEKIWGRSVPSPLKLKEYLRWEGFHLADGRPYDPSERPLARALFRGDVVMGEEFEVLRGDGSRATIQMNAAPLLNASGEIVEGVGTLHDVTAHRRAEEEIRLLNARLEQRVKERTAELEEMVKRLDTFTYSVAHDFRAPLRGVSGLSQLLVQDYAGRTLDGEGLEYLHRMADCAQKMDTLISDLLSYSRTTRTPIQVETVDMDALILGVVDQQREFLRERNASVNVRRNLPAVLGHDAMLAHAVSNLLTNAVKFVAPGVQPKVDIWAESKGEWVRFWVEDNGIGIPAGYHDRVFGIFQRLNSQDLYPGTGIGLAIARAAIERVGGRVGVESQPGEGSRFWIELPKPRPA